MTGAEHRDLDGHVQQLGRLERDAVRLVAEHHDRAAPRGPQLDETDRLVGQLDTDHVATGCALGGEPGEWLVHPVHARWLAQGVALGERFADPWLARYREACTDGVAGAVQGA